MQDYKIRTSSGSGDPARLGGLGRPPETFTNRDVCDERTWTYSPRVSGGLPNLPNRRSGTGPDRHRSNSQK
jgi:hypothetical protein